MANALHPQAFTPDLPHDPSQCCATRQSACSQSSCALSTIFHGKASFSRSVSYMTSTPWKGLERMVPKTIPILYFIHLCPLPHPTPGQRSTQLERGVNPFTVEEDPFSKVWGRLAFGTCTYVNRVKWEKQSK